MKSIVAALLLACATTSAPVLADGPEPLPPLPAAMASAQAAPSDVRCAVDPGTYVIALARADAENDSAFDRSTPACSTAWLRQASADLQDLRALFQWWYRVGRAAGRREGATDVAQHTLPPPQPAAPVEAAQPAAPSAGTVLLQSLAAGMKAFGEHPLGPQPGPAPRVNCTSTRIGQQVFTSCN